MKRQFILPLHLLVLITLIVISFNKSYADSLVLPSKPTALTKPSFTPSPPSLSEKAYLLVDSDSGKILAEKNSHQRSCQSTPSDGVTARMTF